MSQCLVTEDERIDIKYTWFDIRCRRRTTESTLLLHLEWMVFSSVCFLKSWHRLSTFSTVMPIFYAFSTRCIACLLRILQSKLLTLNTSWMLHKPSYLNFVAEHFSRLLSRVKIGRDLWEIVFPLRATRNVPATVPKTMRDYSRSERKRFRCAFLRESKISRLQDGKLEKFNVLNVP